MHKMNMSMFNLFSLLNKDNETTQYIKKKLSTISVKGLVYFFCWIKYPNCTLSLLALSYLVTNVFSIGLLFLSLSHSCLVFMILIVHFHFRAICYIISINKIPYRDFHVKYNKKKKNSKLHR